MKLHIPQDQTKLAIMQIVNGVNDGIVSVPEAKEMMRGMYWFYNTCADNESRISLTIERTKWDIGEDKFREQMRKISF